MAAGSIFFASQCACALSISVERLRSIAAKRGAEAWYMERFMAAHSKRLFYGWYMVGAGSAMQFLQAGLMTQSFGAYVAVLQAERGRSKTALSVAAGLPRP